MTHNKLKIQSATLMAAAGLMLSPMTTTIAMAQKADAPFLKIGNETVTYGEFEHMYNQNCSTALTPVSRQEYVTLFTNYKLKVAEAKAQKLDTLQTYKDERAYYINELAKNYIQDTTAMHRLAEQQQKRLTEEVHAVHVLISVSPKASAADTIRAWNRANEALALVRGGKDIKEVAAEYSEDPSAKNNKGDLGYFTAFMMVQPFEDAAFETPVGQTSEIFRTRFGYHFLQVLDRRASEGEVRVQHIMLFVKRGGTAEEEAPVKAKIDSLYKVVTAPGADFGKIASRNSQDQQSAMMGGFMPWFGRKQIIPEFAEPAFALKDSGQISEPVRTPFGWHIIRMVERRTGRPLDEVERMLKRASEQQDAIRNLPTYATTDRLAKEYGFQWVKEGRDTLVNIAIEAKTSDERQQALKTLNIPLAHVGGKEYTVADAAKFAEKWQSSVVPNENLHSISSQIVADYEKSQLDSKYADYRYTKREYEDGLLVFDVSQREVWSQEPDSVTMAQMYESNKSRYSRGGSFRGTIYFCPNTDAANKIRTLVAKGKTEKAMKLADLVVTRDSLEQGDIYDDFIWSHGKVSDYVVVSGTRTDGTPMAFKECKGLIIADFHRDREAAMVERLRQKYAPEQLIKIK